MASLDEWTVTPVTMVTEAIDTKTLRISLDRQIPYSLRIRFALDDFLGKIFVVASTLSIIHNVRSLQLCTCSIKACTFSFAMITPSTTDTRMLSPQIPTSLHIQTAIPGAFQG